VDVTLEARRATAVGIFSAVCLLGNAVGAVAFGYLAHGAGYSVMWTALAVVLSGGIVASFRLAPGAGVVRMSEIVPPARAAQGSQGAAAAELSADR
jgi:hypothetical protein